MSDDGTFQLFLDRGTYVIRVEPAGGSALPWVYQIVSVASAPLDLEFVVPAPARRAFQLLDDQQHSIGGALVRVFFVPDVGPSVEVGRTYSDETGTATIYVDPNMQ